jgi:predicted DNA-binding transcriptional regulator YafY
MIELRNYSGYLNERNQFMRADRLVSILMLLQRHGKLSARQLASTLEVSVRTIYRDMDALSAAGIPVYAERGAGGGCCLLEDYRTDLTGMTAGEAQALLLLSAPGPLDSLGIGQDLRAALRKLYAALPDNPVKAYQPQSRVLLDWSAWKEQQPAKGLIELLYRAVNGGHQIRITYRILTGAEIERVVNPLGLVAKEGAWYLVFEANGKVGHRRAEDLANAEWLEATFPYPQSFDLVAYWQEVCARAGTRQERFQTMLLVDQAALPVIRYVLRSPDLYMSDQQDGGGLVHLELSFESFEAARRVLLSLGGAVEVLEPEALRLSLADYARQILARYAEG